MRAILILVVLTSSASARPLNVTERADKAYELCMGDRGVTVRGPFSEVANAKAENFCTCWAAIMASRITADDEIDRIKQVSAQADSECDQRQHR